MDRLEILLDMIEHPDRYTEQQVNDLLKDEDIRKHYDIMVAMRMAFLQENEESANAIGSRKKDSSSFISFHFAQRPLVLRSSFKKDSSFKRKIAAMFLVAIFMGGLAFAALCVYKVCQPHISRPVEETPTAIDTTRNSCTANATIRFENTRLDSLLTIVAEGYHHVLVFKDDEPRRLRISTTWQTQEPLSVFIGRMKELDGLNLTLHHDTILVSQPSAKP